MLNLNNFVVPLDSTLLESANIINESKTRACVVVENDFKVVGILSEGDILRAILNDVSLKSDIKSLINSNFYFINKNEMNTKKIEELFQIKNVTLIPIIDENMRLVNVLTLNEYLKDLKTNLSTNQ